MPSTDIPDSQTCAGRRGPPAGPATETGALLSERQAERNSKTHTHTQSKYMRSWPCVLYVQMKRYVTSEHDHYVTLKASLLSSCFSAGEGGGETGLI